MGIWKKIKAWFSGKKCTCAQSPDDGKFYCYREIDGKLKSCRGPYNTLQECIDQTGEKCNS
jgi:hypothetical protein